MFAKLVIYLAGMVVINLSKMLMCDKCASDVANYILHVRRV